MPFEQRVPRPFTSSGVRMHAPCLAGIYGVSNAREWIYIGIANNIRDALLDHLGEPHTSLMKREPSGFVFEVCEGMHCAARQDRLVLEYEPTCNRQLTRLR